MRVANTAPVAGDDSFSARPEFSLSIPFSALLGNDRDPDGGPLRLVGFTGTGGLARPGEFVDFVGGTGGFVGDGELFFFAGAASRAGTARFTYTVADDAGLTATAAVSVRFGPEPLEPFRFALAEDTSVVVARTDLSGLGGGLDFGQPSHGRVELRLIDGGPGAEIVYVPEADYNGADGFTLLYRALGSPTLEREVLLSVTPVDEPGGRGGYVRGSEGGDRIDRSAATERVMIAGLGGDDTLVGGAGNDALNGGAGNDVLRGGSGDDLLTGGAGVDRVAGGAGRDTFAFAAGDLATAGTLDLVVDFEGAGVAGGDFVRLSGFGAGASLQRVGFTGSAWVYEVQDAAGAGLGRFALSAGGIAGATLGAGDYGFY